MAAEIKFIRGSKPVNAEGALVTTGLNENAIYFFTNTHEIYMGGNIYGVNPETIATIQGAIAALQATDTTQGGKITDLETWMATAKTQISNNASAAEAASNAAAAAQGDVDALEEYVGTLPEGVTASSIVAYIEEKTSGIATEGAMTALSGRVSTVEGKVAAIEADYLKAADKTELEGKITAEAQAREAADNALDTRLDKVETFFQTAEDETLDTALDTLIEIQKYITTEGSEADEMVKDIAQNARDIDALEGRMTTAESDIDAVEGRMTTAEGEIDALQAYFNGSGEGTVADMIADAVAAEAALREAGDQAAEASAAAALAAAQAADGKAVAAQGEVDALEIVVAGKADNSVVEGIDARLLAAEGEIDTLQGASHTHSNKAVLDGISSAKVSAWDNTLTEAKAYADSLLAWGQL